MRGPLDGKMYPKDYTFSERRSFRKYAKSAREFYTAMLGDRYDRPTVDMFSDSEMLHGTPNYGGLLCEAGRLFFKVEPNGDVLRCGASRRYGNFLKGTFKGKAGISLR